MKRAEVDRLNGSSEYPLAVDGPVLYPVRDSDGKRTGIWLAELAD